jgi:hypothetical protein
MPGRLPDPNHRRRNKPEIPTTNLPAEGRTKAPPRPPKWIHLGEAGTAWWKWAWHTPQAAAWSVGSVDVLAKRASLEDDLAALAEVEGLDISELLGIEWNDSVALLDRVIRRVAALATGRLAILKLMAEMDRVFGLTAKGQADLRWKIVPSEKETLAEVPSPPVRRLKAVDNRAG